MASGVRKIPEHLRMTREDHQRAIQSSRQDVEINKWAGEVSWSLEAFPVEVGSHTFKWLFIKDGGVTSGSDAVWIDFVVFPPLNENASDCGTGDMNQDGINNVLDVVSLVYCTLGDNCESCAGDMNQDDILNVLDIVLLINAILGTPYLSDCLHTVSD